MRADFCEFEMFGEWVWGGVCLCVCMCRSPSQMSIICKLCAVVAAATAKYDDDNKNNNCSTNNNGKEKCSKIVYLNYKQVHQCSRQLFVAMFQLAKWYMYTAEQSIVACCTIVWKKKNFKCYSLSTVYNTITHLLLFFFGVYNLIRSLEWNSKLCECLFKQHQIRYTLTFGDTFKHKFFFSLSAIVWSLEPTKCQSERFTTIV